MKTSFSMMVRKLNPDAPLVIADLKGEIILTNFNEFKAAMDKLLSLGSSKILLNCEHLDFIASIALSKFLDMKEHFNDPDGEIIFYSIKKSIKEAFETIGFYDQFKIFENEKDALAALKTGNGGGREYG